MLSNRENLLCRYHYDPLDRLVDCSSSLQPNTQRFYLKDRLATEIQGAEQRSVMQHEDQLLAQQQRQSGRAEVHLLATDQKRSILALLDSTHAHPLAFTAYGHCPAENGFLSLLGFNGELPDSLTGHYLLGNGYRAFNPVLMRFNSPDSWSPFGQGGLNAYAYCVGDPVNLSDSTGHIPNFLKPMLRSLGAINKPARTTPSIDRVVPPIAIQQKSEIYTLVGYHGTSKEYAEQMQLTGPKVEFDTKSNLSFGPGFYSTSKVEKARRYADFKAIKMFDTNPDGLLAVYLKNPATKKIGKDYKFIPEHRELVINKKIYSDVLLVRFREDRYTDDPDINKIFNIQKTAHSMRNT